MPNPYDLDADGDGILDTREAGLADANNDGIADGTGGADGWSDTIDALASLNLPNTDGSFTYSKVIVISLTINSPKLTVYPNPVIDYATVNFTTATAQTVTIKVYDLNGKKVVTKVYKAHPGSNTIQLNDWNRLSSGEYVIEMAIQNFKTTQKVSHNR